MISIAKDLKKDNVIKNKNPGYILVCCFFTYKKNQIKKQTSHGYGRFSKIQKLIIH